MTDPVFLFDPDTDDVPVNGDGLNAGWTITLPASVKRHALGAMRLAEGDGLSLTDGRGLCVKTTLVDAQAGLVSVERVGRQPQPVTRLVLIQALAKTGHDEAAIDMATQIGVDDIAFAHLDAGDVVRHELVGRIVEAYDRHDATRVRRNRGKESREDAR